MNLHLSNLAERWHRSYFLPRANRTLEAVARVRLATVTILAVDPGGQIGLADVAVPGAGTWTLPYGKIQPQVGLKWRVIWWSDGTPVLDDAVWPA